MRQQFLNTRLVCLGRTRSRDQRRDWTTLWCYEKTRKGRRRRLPAGAYAKNPQDGRCLVIPTAQPVQSVLEQNSRFLIALAGL
jgi:hypothetical protein